MTADIRAVIFYKDDTMKKIRPIGIGEIKRRLLCRCIARRQPYTEAARLPVRRLRSGGRGRRAGLSPRVVALHPEMPRAGSCPGKRSPHWVTRYLVAADAIKNARS